MLIHIPAASLLQTIQTLKGVSEGQRGEQELCINLSCSVNKDFYSPFLSIASNLDFFYFFAFLLGWIKYSMSAQLSRFGFGWSETETFAALEGSAMRFISLLY